MVCSDVIEHVPLAEQGGFARDLLSLLKPGGFLICTTPRGDALQAWMQLCGTPNQPIEDWLTEAQLRDVFSGQGFVPLANERLHIRGTGTDYLVDPTAAELSSPQVLPLYQIWLFCAPQPVAFAPPAAAGTFSIQQCDNLLEQALTAIESGTPQVGLSLLANAIQLAPDNRKYRDLYASLARKLGVGELV